MAVQLDNFSTEQKRHYVAATVAIGLVLSNVSFVLRVWARLVTVKKLGLEDWFMLAGLLLSYATAVCLIYGLTTGLAEPFGSLTQEQRRGFLLSVWIIQKFQPPTLFCIKASILIFNAYIFKNRIFLRISWVIATITLLWSIGSVIGTIFQCSPPSFFWDKSGGPNSGRCASNTLLTIGLTSGVLSCIGDVVIFLMPIPLLLKLKVDKKTRMGLVAIFTLGIFVVITSFIRWIALLGAPRDGFNSNQVQVGVWTYLEMSIGVTCGNLPFLAPLVGCVGPRRSKSSAYYLRHRAGYAKPTSNKKAKPAHDAELHGSENRGHAGMSYKEGQEAETENNENAPVPPKTSLPRFINGDHDGFTRLYDSISLSSAERADMVRGRTDSAKSQDLLVGDDTRLGDQIELGPITNAKEIQHLARAVVKESKAKDEHYHY
ncbi:hypothetical protein V8F20_009835 [Naviculisporaceae sp. PSN 640]